MVEIEHTSTHLRSVPGFDQPLPQPIKLFEVSHSRLIPVVSRYRGKPRRSASNWYAGHRVVQLRRQVRAEAGGGFNE